MKIFTRKLDRKIGRAPGDTNYYGEEDRKETVIKLYQYNSAHITERIIHNPEEINTVSSDMVTWIDIEGFQNIDAIKNIGSKLDIHEMVLEDIFNVNHLPKYEEGDEYLIFIIKSFNEEGDATKAEQVILLMKKNLVISFRENVNKLLPPKIERLKAAKGRARGKNADYLFFVLLDTFIDSYYYYFERIREKINNLDTRILQNTNENHIQEIYELKNELTSVRNYLFPLKVAMNELLSDESELIDDDNYKFYNDCKDHINELIEYYNSFGEMINTLVTLNENNLNNNTNRIMKVLTIIATIFIPLTFIAGIYGMNFEYIPELSWKYGYFAAIFSMILIGLFILIYMKKKKWF